jgi:hypothetical protein
MLRARSIYLVKSEYNDVWCNIDQRYIVASSENEACDKFAKKIGYNSIYDMELQTGEKSGISAIKMH